MGIFAEKMWVQMQKLLTFLAKILAYLMIKVLTIR